MANIEYVDKLYPVFTIPKRLKIIVGGRGSTKSTAIGGYVAAKMSCGELWCCAREFQNSIDESVHRNICDEIERNDIKGFTPSNTSINHISGGRNFYRGLARNISSLKSTLSGIDGLWIEEGEDLSSKTLEKLTASVRLNAIDTEKKIAGEDIKFPEIIVTMNRGSINDPVSKAWLSRAESELERCGYYEDDNMMVVELNYTDMPKSWFENSGLESERADDYINMNRAQYDHKWLGKYLELVENAIITPEWFDACIDSHIKLGIKPLGVEVVAHDPSDEGDDSKGLVYRHGIVVKDIQEKVTGDINAGGDWASGYAATIKSDAFIWDCDGMGVGLKRQVSESLEPKNIQLSMFKGSNSPRYKDRTFEKIGDKTKTNAETFLNQRAQGYWLLRERMRKTHDAVVNGNYQNPDELISICSSIELMTAVKAEVCRIPLKPNGSGKIQILSKPEMKKLGIPSPNLADSLMMAMFYEAPLKKKVIENAYEPINTPFARR